MNEHISAKKISIALGVVLFAVLVIFSAARLYYRFASVQYFGKITKIENSSFLIQTDKGAEKTILINHDIIIRRGRRPIAGRLQVGDYVIVVGVLNEADFIEADVVRVIEVSPLPPL